MSTTRLKDIAEELGVSLSTVSRALNGTGRINPETREKILRRVKEAAYLPNAVARSLRLSDARNVGIVVPDIANSFYASVLKGAQQVCRDHGYTLMVCNSDENSAFEEDALKVMLEKQVSGLILASVGERCAWTEHYARLNIPIVYIDNIPEGAEATDSVTIDNRKAARELTTQMIARGHTRIGMLAGPLNQSTGRQRYEGFVQAMAESGLALTPGWICEGDFKFASGLEGMRRILEREPRPTAMIISNNFMTYGALNALRGAGLEVPGDMAVAAFDAEDHTGLVRPLISSINQPASDIGARSASMIMARLSCEEGAGLRSGGGPRNLVLMPILVSGDSW